MPRHADFPIGQVAARILGPDIAGSLLSPDAGITVTDGLKAAGAAASL